MTRPRVGVKSSPQGELDFGISQAAARDEETGSTEALMERVVDPQSVARAISRVKSNHGSPGTDGMTVEGLDDLWESHGARICQKLLAGNYVPCPVRRVVIPKPGGGERLLGIPTVQDRVVQQMLLSALAPIFEPLFSDSSYGFRPGRSAHGAVSKGKEIVGSGRSWVVDIDLEKFFDTVNHDVLMALVARRIADKRVLKLLRRYLNSGVMLNGVVVRSWEGTPQGGPLSPLLANVMLHELDTFLESSGHSFVRYADDCNIYVESEAEGETVMASVTRFLEVKLRLRVNAQKSAVAKSSERRFPGFHAL
jgi:RNA-directed DNA polymerase